MSASAIGSGSDRPALSDARGHLKSSLFKLVGYAVLAALVLKLVPSLKDAWRSLAHVSWGVAGRSDRNRDRLEDRLRGCLARDHRSREPLGAGRSRPPLAAAHRMGAAGRRPSRARSDLRPTGA